jgi:CelD/BcsL family acetyltransferase involved in cellulose biosynthesis
MRQVVLNELRPTEITAVRGFLEREARAGALPEVFWLSMPEELLEPLQREHAPTCGPFVFGIELGDDFASFELLVRSQGKLHCGCTAYATSRQRESLLRFIDRLVEETGLRA